MIRDSDLVSPLIWHVKSSINGLIPFKVFKFNKKSIIFCSFANSGWKLFKSSLKSIISLSEIKNFSFFLFLTCKLLFSVLLDK